MRLTKEPLWLLGTLVVIYWAMRTLQRGPVILWAAVLAYFRPARIEFWLFVSGVAADLVLLEPVGKGVVLNFLVWGLFEGLDRVILLRR